MITKDQIDSWIQMYNTSDNCEYQKKYNEPIVGRGFLKRDLVEAKMQVDRWGTVITDWIFHSSKKDLIESLFPHTKETGFDPDEIRRALEVTIKHASSASILDKILTDDELIEFAEKINIKKPYHVWGADIHFIDDIDPDTAMGVALQKNKRLMNNESNNIANSIVVFNVPG